MKNHVGTFECKLCLTLHSTEGNYLAHTQGKRHQQNLGRRAAKDTGAFPGAAPGSSAGGAGAPLPGGGTRTITRRGIKIGRPGYRVVKSIDPHTKQRALAFEVDYPEAADAAQPRHRFMSAFEQRVEPADKNYQYLLCACEPYETVAFKIPAHKIDKREGMFAADWDGGKKKFVVKLHFIDGQYVMAEEASKPESAGAPKPKITYDYR